jgi:hypothetical protein
MTTECSYSYHCINCHDECTCQKCNKQKGECYECDTQICKCLFPNGFCADCELTCCDFSSEFEGCTRLCEKILIRTRLRHRPSSLSPTKNDQPVSSVPGKVEKILKKNKSNECSRCNKYFCDLHKTSLRCDMCKVITFDKFFDENEKLTRDNKSLFDFFIKNNTPLIPNLVDIIMKYFSS